MKTLSLILFIFAALSVQAQNECPPTAWCHPDGDGLGETYASFTQDTIDFIDTLGNIFNGDACEDANYAEQVYCYPAQWLADAIPCMYGENTPQHSLCEEGNGGGNGGGGNNEGENPDGDKPNDNNNPPPPTENNPNTEEYSVNSQAAPFFTKQKNAKKLTQSFLDKKKRGDIITKWPKGYTLKLKSKFFTNKSKTEFVAIMEMVNSKGKVVGTPILMSKGNALYVTDVIPKKRKK